MGMCTFYPRKHLSCSHLGIVDQLEASSNQDHLHPKGTVSFLCSTSPPPGFDGFFADHTSLQVEDRPKTSYGD